MLPIELVANISDLMLLFNQLSTVFKNAYAPKVFKLVRTWRSLGESNFLFLNSGIAVIVRMLVARVIRT